MLLEFEKKLAEFIEKNRLFEPAANVLLAVSGGADSTALLYAMQALKAGGVLSGGLIVAHINHQLRGRQAKADEDFVVRQAEGLNLVTVTRKLDVEGFALENKLSIETAARKVRIKALVDIAESNDCELIATAHQKDDNAETVVQRLARGTGFRGLGGIWPVRVFDGRHKFVRPLLAVRRAEIVEYLKLRNLIWREDKTNEDISYSRRNFIRHRLLPELQKQCRGSIAEELCELSESARKFYVRLCNCTDNLWPQLADCRDGRVALDLQKFSAQVEPVKLELIRRCLAKLGVGEGQLTYRHYEALLDLAEQNIGGREIKLPNGLSVWHEYRNLIFSRTAVGVESDRQISESAEIRIPCSTRFGRYLIEATVFEAGLGAGRKFKARKESFVEWFDLNEIKQPVVIRFRREGDRFIPLGLTEEKKVGRFLISSKVPQRIRPKVLIVADSEEIIWVWPIRISDKTKVTGRTQTILQLQITDTSPGVWGAKRIGRKGL